MESQKIMQKVKAGPEARLILAVGQDAVYNKKDSLLSLIEDKNINWDRVKTGLAYHGLVPFAYLALKEYFAFLPLELVKVLEASYYYYLKYMCFLEQEFLDLFSVFDLKGLSLIPIKGVALLGDLYVDYPVRPSTDIDVLVKEEDIDRATLILEELGYKKELHGLRESYWRQKQYHLVFTQRVKAFSPIIELHWDLDYRRKRRRLLPEMFKRLREFAIQDKKIKLLSVEDTFFGLALHQRRFGKTLALRDACDMARLLNKYALSFDWDYCLRESMNSKVCCTIFFALYQVKFFFGVNVPKGVWEGLRVSGWKKRLIQRCIEKNTLLAGQNAQNKNLYLKTHFLLYNDLWEPIDYILNIPLEQFANFYGLRPYVKKTEFFYRNRLFYILFRALFNFFKAK